MTTKLQNHEVADVETQDLPDIDKAIADEVAKLVKAERDAERAEVRQDLEEAFWLAGIEAFSAIAKALAPKAEITLTTAPAADNEAFRKALATIPRAKRDSIKSIGDVYAYHATAKGGK